MTAVVSPRIFLLWISHLLNLNLNYLDRRWKAGSKISMQKQFYLTNMELIFGKRFWEQFEVLIDSLTKSISFKFIIAFVLMLSDYSTIFCG